MDVAVVEGDALNVNDGDGDFDLVPSDLERDAEKLSVPEVDVECEPDRSFVGDMKEALRVLDRVADCDGLNVSDAPENVREAVDEDDRETPSVGVGPVLVADAVLDPRLIEAVLDVVISALRESTELDAVLLYDRDAEDDRVRVGRLIENVFDDDDDLELLLVSEDVKLCDSDSEGENERDTVNDVVRVKDAELLTLIVADVVLVVSNVKVLVVESVLESVLVGEYVCVLEGRERERVSVFIDERLALLVWLSAVLDAVSVAITVAVNDAEIVAEGEAVADSGRVAENVWLFREFVRVHDLLAVGVAVLLPPVKVLEIVPDIVGAVDTDSLAVVDPLTVVVRDASNVWLEVGVADLVNVLDLEGSAVGLPFDTESERVRLGEEVGVSDLEAVGVLEADPDCDIDDDDDVDGSIVTDQVRVDEPEWLIDIVESRVAVVVNVAALRLSEADDVLVALDVAVAVWLARVQLTVAELLLL